MKLAAIVFVALLHDGEVARLGWERVRVEVWVLQSVNGVDAFLPVETEKLLEELDSSGAKSSAQVSRFTLLIFVEACKVLTC